MLRGMNLLGHGGTRVTLHRSGWLLFARSDAGIGRTKPRTQTDRGLYNWSPAHDRYVALTKVVHALTDEELERALAVNVARGQALYEERLRRRSSPDSRRRDR